MSALENVVSTVAPTIYSSVTGGVIGGVVGYVSSPFVALASVVSGIGSNIITNKNHHIREPRKVARDWVCYTITVGAGTGAVISVVYRVASYSLGLLAEYLIS